jgi:hypothetical protein
MSGLYHRALQIYRQTVGLRLVGRGEEGPDIEDVSPEDRDKILRQIDEVINRNRLKVEPDTFTITAKRSGVGLPLLINLAIAAVLVGVILFYSFLFNRQEDVLAAGAGTIASAESKLIETLREESQEQLQQKEREILSFQQQLRETLEEQRRLESQTDHILRQREEQLEEQFQRALAEERQRLLDQGLAGTAIDDRLKDFESEKRAEVQAEFEAFRRRTEEEAAEREAALAGLIREYEQNLQAAQTERSDLERQLQERETELQRQFEAQAKALESDRARVAAQLARLQERQRQEELVRDQILGAYERVNVHIAGGEYDQALEQLESIRSYLNQEPARSLAGIRQRRPVELFIISSLEDLIRSRRAQEQRDLESLVEARTRIQALNRGVREGSRLLEQGDTAAARERFLSALGEISSAREGHERLAGIEGRRRSQERQTVDSALAQGRSLFETEQYRASLDRYRQALTLLLEDSEAAQGIVDQIAEISARLSPPAAPPASEPREASVQATQEQLRMIEQYRERIASLEQENARMADQLARIRRQEQTLQGENEQLSAALQRLEDQEQSLERENAGLSEQLKQLQEQRQLLQGDQSEVAAQVQRLQEEKAAFDAAAERLRAERDRLTAQVAQLEADKNGLTAERERLMAQMAELEAENERLSSERERLSAQVAQLEAEKDALSSEQERLAARGAQLQGENDRLAAEQERLESQMEQAQEARERLAEQQSRAEEAQAVREQLRERLAALQSRYQARRQTASRGSMTPPETLAELLEAKLLTWQIIGSEPVATQHPELYDTMDRYLDTLTEQSRLEGRYTAVEDIIAVVDALVNAPRTAEVSADLWRRYSHTDREDMLSRLLDKLELLLE